MDNNLDNFNHNLSAINNQQEIMEFSKEVVDTVNTCLTTYKEIQIEKEKTNQVKSQGHAFIEGQKEETKRVSEEENNKTKRLELELENKIEEEKIELQKYNKKLENQNFDKEKQYEIVDKQIEKFTRIIDHLIEQYKRMSEKIDYNEVNKEILDRIEKNEKAIVKLAIELKELTVK